MIYLKTKLFLCTSLIFLPLILSLVGVGAGAYIIYTNNINHNWLFALILIMPLSILPTTLIMKLILPERKAIKKQMYELEKKQLKQKENVGKLAKVIEEGLVDLKETNKYFLRVTQMNIEILLEKYTHYYEVMGSDMQTTLGTAVVKVDNIDITSEIAKEDRDTLTSMLYEIYNKEREEEYNKRESKREKEQQHKKELLSSLS